MDDTPENTTRPEVLRAHPNGAVDVRCPGCSAERTIYPKRLLSPEVTCAACRTTFLAPGATPRPTASARATDPAAWSNTKVILSGCLASVVLPPATCILFALAISVGETLQPPSAQPPARAAIPARRIPPPVVTPPFKLLSQDSSRDGSNLRVAIDAEIVAGPITRRGVEQLLDDLAGHARANYSPTHIVVNLWVAGQDPQRDQPIDAVGRLTWVRGERRAKVLDAVPDSDARMGLERVEVLAQVLARLRQVMQGETVSSDELQAHWNRVKMSSASQGDLAVSVQLRHAAEAALFADTDPEARRLLARHLHMAGVLLNDLRESLAVEHPGPGQAQDPPEPPKRD